MRKAMLAVAAVCLLLCSVAPALAQEQGPPKVLQIYREEIKVGKGFAYQTQASSYVQAFQRANSEVHWLAVNSVSGTNEALYLVGFDSFAAMEKQSQADEKNQVLMTEMKQVSAHDADVVQTARSVVAVFQPTLSYQPEVNIADMRAFRIVTYRVRPGHESEFAQVIQTVLDAYKKANHNVHTAVYSVASGMPGPTYFIFVPMKSLAEVDTTASPLKVVEDQLGADAVTRLNKLRAESVLSFESNFYTFNPKSSNVTKEMLARASDKEFWQPKEQVATKKPAATKTVPASAKKPQ